MTARWPASPSCTWSSWTGGRRPRAYMRCRSRGRSRRCLRAGGTTRCSGPSGCWRRGDPALSPISPIEARVALSHRGAGLGGPLLDEARRRFAARPAVDGHPGRARLVAAVDRVALRRRRVGGCRRGPRADACRSRQRPRGLCRAVCVDVPRPAHRRSLWCEDRSRPNVEAGRGRGRGSARHE